MKRKNILFLALLSLIVLLSGCSGDETSKKGTESDSTTPDTSSKLSEPGKLPIVEEPLTLNIFAGQTPQSADDWNDVLIWNTYEEMTGINVKWELVPSNSLEEKRNLVLASGQDLPDAFHTAGVPVMDLLKYGEQGTFIALNDLIEEHAPNLTAIFKENPEIEQGLTFPDGNIYSLPTLVEPDFSSILIGPKPWINQEWLDALGMDMPETTEEYYDFLKAVKDKDPNGNGKADEIPFGSYSIGMLIRWLNGSFGLANRGANHGYIDMEPNGDEMRFIPTSDEYKEMLEYLHRLFDEGLIEQNIFSMETNQYLANASEGLYGSTVSHGPMDLFPGEAGDVFVPAPALEGPFGDKLISGVNPPVLGQGAFVITSANEHPEATVKWIDYLYSEEGSKLFFMGVEGETYEVSDDGEYQYLDKIRNSADGLSLEQELAKYLTWPGGGYPGLISEQFFKGLESSVDSLEAAEKLEPFVIDEVWPSFTHTIEESKVLSSIGADIEKYVVEMRDKFISGEEPFSKWDQYVETIEKIGLEEYMDIKKTALDRLKQN